VFIKNMSAASFPINIEKNSDYLLVVTLTDNATPPSAIDLTNATIIAQVRDFSGGDLIASFIPTILNAADGYLQLSMSANVSKQIPTTSGENFHRYDVLVSWQNGTQIRVLEGPLYASDYISQ
jgi:hypothetical protein